MAIAQIVTEVAGEVGYKPRLVRIVCTDSFIALTTPGYLNNAARVGFIIDPTDFIFIHYDSGTFGIFTVTISDGIITLHPYLGQGNVTLPVVNGDFAVFDGTIGTIKDKGCVPSDSSKTTVVMGNPPFNINHIAKYSDTSGTISDGGVLGTAASKAASDNSKPTLASINGSVIGNRIAVFTDTSGTVDDTTTPAIHDGNIQAGLSGTAGSLSSFPSTPSKGSLQLVAVPNAGDTVTTISNLPMNQKCIVSIPDPGTTTADFAVCPSPLVKSNLVKALGTQGLLVDAGARIISNTTAIYGGGSTSNVFIANGLTSSAKGSAVIRTSTNSVSINKALPGTNTLTITFSADPGPFTTVDYIYTTNLQT